MYKIEKTKIERHSNCSECGINYIQARRDQKYCSTACRTRAYQKRREARIKQEETKKQKIYISGQISNLDIEEVSKKFYTAQEHLVSLGYDVVNPLELQHANINHHISYFQI